MALLSIFFFLPELKQSAVELRNYALAFGTPIEILDLDLRFEDIQRLAYFREQALTLGLITPNLKQPVKAILRHGSNSLKAEVKLKGQWIDHLKGEKWSLKVDLEDDQTIFGMSRFALQHPGVRGFLNEWVYLKALKRESLMALGYDFVQVRINGKDRGIFAVEESINNGLIRDNGAKEGVLLGFDDEGYYHPTQDGLGRLAMPVPLSSMEETAAALKPYDQKNILQSKQLTQDWLQAQSLLESLRRQRRSNSQVLDVEKWAKYYALSEVMGATDTAWDWKDLVFYFNPQTQLLEPVGKEGGRSPLKRLIGFDRRLGSPLDNNFLSILFSDPQFFARYVFWLNHFSQPTYLNSLFGELKPHLELAAKRLHKEWPGLNYNHQQIETNAKLIQKILHPSKGIHAYLQEHEKGLLKFRIANLLDLPVEILGLGQKAQQTPLLLSAKVPGSPADFQDWETKAPPNLKIHELAITYRILGMEENLLASAFPWPLP